MKLYQSLIFLSLISISCESEKKTLPEIEAEKAEYISGVQVCKDADLLFPQTLTCIDNGLLMQEHNDSCYLAYYPHENGSSVKYIVKKGQGPLEFINARNVYFNPNFHTLFVYDTQSKIGRTFHVEEDGDIIIDNKHLINTLINTPYAGNEVIPLGENFVTNGVFDDKHLAIIDSVGNILHTFGIYPGDKSNIDDISGFFLVNQTNLTTNYNGTCVVVAGAYNNWLAFYDVTGEPKLIKEYFSRDAKATIYHPDESITSLKESNDDILTYSKIVPTMNFVYTLYDGNTVMDYKERTNKRRTILKFTWDGEFVDAYKIPDRILDFSVSNDDNYIYGLVAIDGGEYAVMKYNIKDI